MVGKWISGFHPFMHRCISEYHRPCTALDLVLLLPSVLLPRLLCVLLFAWGPFNASSCYQVRKLAHKSLDPDNWAAELMRASKVHLPAA
jgi:hypothetical protein